MPFLSEDVLDPENDERHDCEPAGVSSVQPAKANFIFALASLIEAVAFNSAILYKDESLSLALQSSSAATGTVLAAKVDKLDPAKNPDILENFSLAAQGLENVKEDIDTILSTADGSMLNATLSNLRAVSKGFAAIAGIPDDLTAKIDKAIDSVGGIAEEFGSQSTKLEQQMNEKLTKNLKKNIEKFNQQLVTDAEGEVSAEELAERQDEVKEVCDVYQNIAIPGAPTPEGC